MLYELVRHAARKRQMTGPIGSAIERRHMFHHYEDGTVNFGIASNLWDRLSRTAVH